MDLKFLLQFSTESLRKDIEDSIGRFYKANGLMPSHIRIDMLETTRVDSPMKEFCLG
jgi:hypothetical protein